MSISTTKGTSAALSERAVEGFGAGLRGSLIRPGDAAYDEARTIWNAMIDRRPGLIVRCLGTADVIRAVNFAQENDLLVAVRSGGHNIAGNAVCDGGLMIDLSRMRSVRVDPKARKAYVEAGATLGDFDHEAQAFGLATPLGINSTTGVAGLTLGGGFGWLSRKYGMSVDCLLSADVVTAQGKLVRASAKENADLFWAIRGGGGNFGIVTSFEFRLYPVGPTVFAGLLVFPLSQAEQVLKKYRKFVEKIPDEMNVWVVLRRAPPLPFLPPEVHGTGVVVLAVFYAGDAKKGNRLIAPLRGFGELLGEQTGPVPYTAWQRAFDPLLTPGARNYWKSHNFTRLSDETIGVVVKYAGNLPTSASEAFIGLIGGRAGRIPRTATAYSQRDAKFVLNVHTRWESPGDDKRCVAWAREFFDASAADATGGVYVNFMPEDEAGRTPAAYKPETWKRLQKAKAKWDPKNLFRLNQNVKPSR